MQIATGNSGSVQLDPHVHHQTPRGDWPGGDFPPPGRPRVDIPSAILRFPWLVLIPALLLAAAGGYLGRAKPEVYTAQSQVLVGEPGTASAGALPGLVQSEQSLAGIYAREIDSNTVVDNLAHRFNTTAGEIVSNLTATPDPQVPIIRISATARNARTAVAMANAAATAFANYTTSTSQSNGPAQRLLSAYQQSVVAVAHAKARQQQISNATSNQQSSAVIQAGVATSVAQLNEAALASQYEDMISAQQSAPVVKPFLRAQTAAGNRTSHIELYAFAGLAAGLLIGAALATLLANRKTTRAATGA